MAQDLILVAQQTVQVLASSPGHLHLPFALCDPVL